MVGLVVLSLALLTFSYRSNALDPVESTSASVLRPFEIAANRVARPFRDAADWTHGVFNAKSENKRLEAENARLRQLNARLQNAFEENAILHRDLRYAQGPTFPKGYDEVGARVLSSPSALDQSVTISAGRNQGIQPEDIVLTNEGLVGSVISVTRASVSKTLEIVPTRPSLVTTTSSTWSPWLRPAEMVTLWSRGDGLVSTCPPTSPKSLGKLGPCA